MACFTTPPLFDTPTQGSPSEFLDETPQNLEGWGYHMVKNA